MLDAGVNPDRMTISSSDGQGSLMYNSDGESSLNGRWTVQLPSEGSKGMCI